MSGYGDTWLWLAGALGVCRSGVHTDYSYS